MSVREHYDKHLGPVYAWMAGDFTRMQREFEQFLNSQDIRPHFSGKAIDLGAGHGIQSVSLARQGFTVVAVDFNDGLLRELEQNAEGMAVTVRKDDIRNLEEIADSDCELIACCGDTITHLSSKDEVSSLLVAMHRAVVPGGRVVLSFRDYTRELEGNDRFIPVKSDDHRIMTCVLDYTPDRVRVTDLLYEKENDQWVQYVSSYDKVRLAPSDVMNQLIESGMSIEFEGVINRMITVVAVKPWI
jgi:SAM-dependent methyltransferase